MEKKKIYFRIPFILDSGEKIPKTIAKKLKKLKILFPNLFLAQTGWDRPRNREKNFTAEFRSYSIETRKFQKNSKKIEKIEKPLSDIIFWQNGVEIGRERGKKILLPNSVPTRPGQENSETNSKKIEKIKKPLPDIIFCQNGMR